CAGPEQAEIVKEQHVRPGVRERGGQSRHRVRPDRRPGRLERAHEAFRKLRLPTEGCRNVPQQDDRVVVALIDRDPDERPWISLGPLTQQRGLAVPGRRDDRRDSTRRRRAEPVDERRPRNGSRPEARRLDLRLEDVEQRQVRSSLNRPERCSGPPGGGPPSYRHQGELPRATAVTKRVSAVAHLPTTGLLRHLPARYAHDSREQHYDAEVTKLLPGRILSLWRRAISTTPRRSASSSARAVSWRGRGSAPSSSARPRSSSSPSPATSPACAARSTAPIPTWSSPTSRCLPTTGTRGSGWPTSSARHGPRSGS